MPDARPGQCAAVLTAGDGWQCERCALAWDDGDEPPACRPVTYGRLIAAAENEADRIRQSLDAIREIRPEQRFRNQGELKKRMEFLKLMKLAETMRERDEARKARERA